MLGDGRAAETDGIGRSACFRHARGSIRLQTECPRRLERVVADGAGRQTVHAALRRARRCVAYVAGAEAGDRAARQACSASMASTVAVSSAACAARRVRRATSGRRGSRRSTRRCRRTHRRGASRYARMLRLMSDDGCAARPRTPTAHPTAHATSPPADARVVCPRAEPPSAASTLYGQGGHAPCHRGTQGERRVGASGVLARRGVAMTRAALGDDSSACVRFSALAETFGRAAAASGVRRRTRWSRQRRRWRRAGRRRKRAWTRQHRLGTERRQRRDDDAPQETYERGDADGWSEAAAGRRVLRFRLVSARARYAHRLWPAGKVLAAWLDAHPELCANVPLTPRTRSLVWTARVRCSPPTQSCAHHGPQHPHHAEPAPTCGCVRLSRPVRRQGARRAVPEIGAGAALPSVVAGALGARPRRERLARRAHAAQYAPQPRREPGRRRRGGGGGAWRRATVVGYDWKKDGPLLRALRLLEQVNGGSGGGDGGSGGGGGVWADSAVGPAVRV